jgi:hypothetical protein
MPDIAYDTTSRAVLQPDPLGEDQWEQEVLPRLPEGWQQQARDLGAFSRVRQLRDPGDLLRGLLAYEVSVRSLRHLGAWSVLIGLGDLSDRAWSKRLRRSCAWLSWMLTRKLAVSACQSPWLVRHGLRRVLLVDGTHLRCEGKGGQVWRVHSAFDLLAGQLSQVQVTTNQVGEHWELFEVQEGDLLVSDSINGDAGRLAWVLEQQAHAVVRFTPQTLPLYDEQGQSIDLLCWLKGRHAPAGRVVSREVWIRDERGQLLALRLVALRLTAEQRQAAVRRKRKKAKQDKRQVQEQTLSLAGWLLLVTTLPAQDWSAAEVLALYRARWHVELFFKRLKQLLDTHRLRCEHAESVRASILLWLLAWVLQEDELVRARLFLQEAVALPEELAQAAAMPEPQLGQEAAISEWMLATLSLDLLRQQVQGYVTAARFRECLPRLQRFLRGSPRQRTHWYSQVCHWLRSPAA